MVNMKKIDALFSLFLECKSIVFCIFQYHVARLPSAEFHPVCLSNCQ